MTAMYKEEVPKASVALTRTTAETVTSGGNVTWRATITNTSQAPLTTATIKKSTAWTTGLAAPTAMIVTPAGGTAKTVPVTATTWTNGVSLGTDIPVGKSATVQFTTKATGTAGQVLRAGITTSGNYSGVSASATVRVKDNDQVIVTPTAEGFISVPTFNFGQVGVAGSTQQHSLKKPLIIMATAHAIPICESRKPNRIELNGAAVTTKISDRQLAYSDPLIVRGGSCFEFLKLQPTYRVEKCGRYYECH